MRDFSVSSAFRLMAATAPFLFFRRPDGLEPRMRGGKAVAAILAAAAFCAAASLSAAQNAQAAESDRAAILILDASGSMWGQIEGGKTKIEIARRVLGDFFTLRDASVPLGVVVYGHNRKGDCSDIEVIAQTAMQEGSGLAMRLNRITPRGKTPLGQSLRVAASQIPRTAEAADIVLVTDGLETCGVDPCAVADELIAEGINIRAHVVGFGLTEQEAQALACIPDKTGGMLLRPQSGDELADALTRTAERVDRAPAEPGRAALNLALQVDAAGRPDAVDWSAKNLATGEERTLGRLVFDGSRTALPVELEGGRWRLVADAGEAGRGELELQVSEGDNRTIYVPFAGAFPDLVMENRGPYTAGVTIALPYEVTREGVARGGADFNVYLLRQGQASADDAITWTYVEGTVGKKLATLQLPPEPGRYTVAFLRNGVTALSDALVRFDIDAELKPGVTLDAPSVVNPGAEIPLKVSGAHYYLDRVEIRKDGQLISYDHAKSLQDLYWPDAPHRLIAPAEPGLYEIVYLRSDATGGDAEIAASQMLEVREGELWRDAPTAPSGGAIQKSGLGDDGMGHGPDDYLPEEDVGFRCDGNAPCEIRDAATGLRFLLPAGWFTDVPSFAPRTSGAADAGEQLPFPSLSFFSRAEVPDTIVLNPHQWIRMNGPCASIDVGELCLFETTKPEVLASYEIIKATLRWDGTRPQPVEDAVPAVLQTCPQDAACVFFEEATGLGGTLPAGWGVHVSTPAADGRSRATWFFFRHGGTEKHIALNQDGNDPGERCAQSAAGLVCELAPDITAAEKAIIVQSLYRKAPARSAEGPLTKQRIDEIVGKLRGAAEARQ
ncbi:Ca-activated chloride channel homolog [Nitratireductor aquimarinus]